MVQQLVGMWIFQLRKPVIDWSTHTHTHCNEPFQMTQWSVSVVKRMTSQLWPLCSTPVTPPKTGQLQLSICELGINNTQTHTHTHKGKHTASEQLLPSEKLRFDHSIAQRFLPRRHEQVWVNVTTALRSRHMLSQQTCRPHTNRGVSVDTCWHTRHICEHTRSCKVSQILSIRPEKINWNHKIQHIVYLCSLIL